MITVMPSADALKSVAAGDGGLAATSRRDGIWVEMSTVPPPVKRQLADTLAERAGPPWIARSAADPSNSKRARRCCQQRRAQHPRPRRAPAAHHQPPGVLRRRIRCRDARQIHRLSGVRRTKPGRCRSAGLRGHGWLGPARCPPTPAASSLGPLAVILTQLDQSATQLGAPTPVLDQVEGHLDRRYVDRTDDLVVAFYQQLIPEASERGRPNRTEREQA